MPAKKSGGSKKSTPPAPPPDHFYFYPKLDPEVRRRHAMPCHAMPWGGAVCALMPRLLLPEPLGRLAQGPRVCRCCPGRAGSLFPRLPALAYVRLRTRSQEERRTLDSLTRMPKHEQRHWKKIFAESVQAKQNCEAIAYRGHRLLDQVRDLGPGPMDAAASARTHAGSGPPAPQPQRAPRSKPRVARTRLAHGLRGPWCGARVLQMNSHHKERLEAAARQYGEELQQYQQAYEQAQQELQRMRDLLEEERRRMAAGPTTAAPGGTAGGEAGAAGHGLLVREAGGAAPHGRQQGAGTPAESSVFKVRASVCVDAAGPRTAPGAEGPPCAREEVAALACCVRTQAQAWMNSEPAGAGASLGSFGSGGAASRAAQREVDVPAEQQDQQQQGRGVAADDGWQHTLAHKGSADARAGGDVGALGRGGDEQEEEDGAFGGEEPDVVGGSGGGAGGDVGQDQDAGGLESLLQALRKDIHKAARVSDDVAPHRDVAA